MKEKRERMMLMKLRGGTAEFQIEVGRWQGVMRDDRICKECQSGEVEDVCHLAATMPCLGPHQTAPTYTAWDGQISGHREPLLRSRLPSFCLQLVPTLVL